MSFRNNPRKIIQLTKEGLLVKIHHSIYSAAKEMDGNSASIKKAASGEMPTAYGFCWAFPETVEE